MTIEHIVKNADSIFHHSRWKYGIVVCPYCGSVHIKHYDNYKYKCNSCKRYFTDRTRTVLHNSKLSTTKWIVGIFEMLSDNRISSTTLSKKLGINQKSAWLMMMKLRYTMKIDDVRLTGIIAIDEVYIGGCLTNFHYGRKIRLLREQNLMSEEDKRYTKSALFALNSRIKSPVFGMIDDKHLVLVQLPNPTKQSDIRTIYKKHVEGDSIAISDESKLYDDWTLSELHTNNHHNNQYVSKEGYSSNKIENAFSWLKRGFTSRITHCDKGYLQLYLNEFCFRHNNKDVNFTCILTSILSGGTITHRGLIDARERICSGHKTKKTRHIYTLSEIKEFFTQNPYINTIKFGKQTYRREDF